MDPSARDLVTLLEQCQQDTLEVFGAGPAGRLAHWQSHQADLPSLVQFIRDRIHSESWENGAKLEAAGKMSLERIVVMCGEPMFDPDDVARAEQTLRMAAITKEV